MRRLIVAFCLIATICAYHVKKYDFDVVLEGTEYKNVPTKYKLGTGLTVLPVENMLSKLVRKLEIDPRAGTEAIMNDYADKIFVNIQHAMVEGGLDPVEMPEMHTGFNYTLIILYHGELDLTQGWLSDLSTVHRGGDVIVTYSSNDKFLEITVPIAFNDLQFTYEYSAKIMGLGPTGGIEGKVEALTAEVVIGFNSETLVLSLDEFYITNAGTITFHFNGNDLVDWLLNLLTDVVLTLLEEVVLLVVEGIIRDGLTSVIDDINAAIGGFLNPTTPVPATTVAAFF